MCNAANAEGQQLDEFPALPTTATQEQRLPIDITHAATQLIDAQAAVYNAKLRVFRTFCAHFNEAAKEFATGPERDFAKHFSTSFLGFWEQTLANTSPASTPTYSGIAANGTASPANPRPKPAATHHQAQGSPVPAPSREDLRVFVRLEADAPARNHIGYAIRAHVASKTGLELNRIPQVLQVNTGWAIRAADKATRDLLIERQAEWADDLGATAVETSQKWYNYVVDNCPRRLTDLYGNEVDYDAAVRDEVNNQTGHTPCANCLGPHAADLAACPARPKRAAQQRQQSQTELNGQPAPEAFCHRVSDTPEGRGTQARSAGETPLADIA
ncbi:reverse transcriptase [Hirsutella rhossiliensis]|uniref:Reverse transcriptase n=1 Tax=Hirsutella rhossiliensis TaxID=111463 RepID=A0A9P8MTR7_9HYPO|nr:reverse transcriptase [Hirsutella rhossiliensis]KAH0961262.1 reverse transcriptase [Hirsutella rhossiliensis]